MPEGHNQFGASAVSFGIPVSDSANTSEKYIERVKEGGRAISSERRLNMLGMRGLSGDELIQALHRKQKELEADQTISPMDKILHGAAIALELQKLERRSDN